MTTPNDKMLEALKAALKPFAELADFAPDDRTMTLDTWMQSYMRPIFKERLKKLTIADLRRAAEAYAGLSSQQPTPTDDRPLTGVSTDGII